MEDLIRIHLAYESMLPTYERYLPDILITLDDVIEDQQNKAPRAKFLKEVPGWGSVLPGKVLIIGEDSNKENPYFENKFFWEALNQTTLKPSDVYIMDCFNDIGNYANIKEFIKYSDPKRIIALGSSTGNRLRSLGIHEFFTLPCPRYWENDRRESSKEYANRMQRILDYVNKNN
jgi:hypothetical protein